MKCEMCKGIMGFYWKWQTYQDPKGFTRRKQVKRFYCQNPNCVFVDKFRAGLT